MSDEQHATSDLAGMPKEHNFISQAIARRMTTLMTFVQPPLDPKLFVAACMTEANKLSLTMPEHELTDQRTVNSFVTAAFNAAIIGLIPGDAQKHLFFAPFYKGKKGDPQQHRLINVIVGYRGYLELAFQSGFLARASPDYVLTGEEVTRVHDRSGPNIIHKIPCPGRPEPSRDNIVAAYLSYETVTGAKDIVFVEKWDLKKSEEKGGEVWRYNYPSMCLKTTFVRGSKRWRLSSAMAAAVMLDEQAERGVAQSQLAKNVGMTEKGKNEPVDFQSLVDDVNPMDLEGGPDGGSEENQSEVCPPEHADSP